jgi:acetolactate synthase-1/3 small subunit
VENRPGVLARVAGLFSRRGFNIESLSVNMTNDPKTSRMTIVTNGDDQVLEQISKQLSKLIDVISVSDHTGEAVVNRELALIKVYASPATRSEIMQIVDIFRARIVDVSEEEVTLEVTGSYDKIDALLKLLEKFGIIETARTGEVILTRGMQPT